MKVALVYKKTAGEGVSQEELTHQLERGGHQVTQAVDVDADLRRLLLPGVELVVAAGGDGTIAEAAKALAHSSVPLAILPRGTANNIAKSLGIQGAIPELIECWPHSVPTACDLGVLRSARQESFFVEGVGVGLIADGIFAALQRTEASHPDTAAQVAEDLQHYRDTLALLKPRRFDITADSHDLSGEYILVEVLNIPSVGPNIVLSGDVSPSDGLLSLVVAREEQRDRLVAYIGERLAGEATSARLPSTRVRNVELRGASVVHIDDETRHLTPEAPIAFGIEPAAVIILAGPEPPAV